MTPLVLLPGLDGTDVFLRPLVAALPASIEPLIVCYPVAGPHTYDGLLRVVADAVAGLDEFYVLGSSFSGPVAVMLAASEPQRVRGVILAASFVRPPLAKLRRFRFAAVGPVIWLFRAVRRLPLWLLRDEQDPQRRAKTETWSRVSARCIAARVRAIGSVDVRETLRQCEQPILCVTFDDDEAVPHDNAEEILRQARRARRVSLPGRHLAISSNPAPLAREIAAFMGEGASGAPPGVCDRRARVEARR